MKKMAEGGFVQSDDDDKLLGNLTEGTSTQQSPLAVPPQPSIALPPPSMPDQTPTAKAPPQPPQAKPIQLPGMPPGVTPDELQGYLNAQKQSLNKFGPQQQMDLENQSLANRNSFG